VSLACISGEIDKKYNACVSLVIFEILTVKLTEAAGCTEFPKLEGHVPQCPIASDATDCYS